MKAVIEHGLLLDAAECSRCGEDLTIRTLSFFTGLPIGRKCIAKENEVKECLENKGFSIDKFRNCGRLPDPLKEKKS